MKPGETTYEGHARTLVALTLLRAGGADERAIAKKLLDEWWLDAVAGRYGDPSQPNTYGTYAVALGISALEALTLEPIADDTSTLTRYTKTPMPEDLKKRLDIATRALLDSASRSGAWGYNVRSFKDSKDGRGGQGYDMSNTQFAALALHDAARGGVEIPKEVADGLVDMLVDGATEDERDANAVAKGPKKVRWSYSFLRDPKTSPAMSFAALSMLAIARSLGTKDARLEETIARGLVDVNKLVKTSNPATEGGHGWGQAYLLYSLEKALDLLEVELLDGNDWFAPIAERVLKTQDAKGGLFGEGDLIDSCLYVLFLQRASFGTSRLGPRTVAKVTPESGTLAALKACSESPSATTRAALDAALSKLVAGKERDEALVLGGLADLSKKGAARDIATRWLHELCGKDPSTEELKASVERLEKVRGSAPEPVDLRSALDRTTLLPVRAFAARKAAADLLVEAADTLQAESLLETHAGSRCAHAFEAALRKSRSDLPVLADDVRPSELRHLVKVARESIAARK